MLLSSFSTTIEQFISIVVVISMVVATKDVFCQICIVDIGPVVLEIKNLQTDDRQSEKALVLAFSSAELKREKNLPIST